MEQCYQTEQHLMVEIIILYIVYDAIEIVDRIFQTIEWRTFDSFSVLQENYWRL